MLSMINGTMSRHGIKGGEMATYTSNLNLYMPDSTDDFGDFREEHNDNMVKIDNAIGGGGGSGGHTIIDPNGNSLPQESGLQFTGGVTVTDDSVNGKTVIDISGGGGNVYGAFIDTDRVIVPDTAFRSSLSYTAVEDCVICLYLVNKGNASTMLEIDGKWIQNYWQSSMVTTASAPIFLKKGQTFTVSGAESNYDSAYHVYGIKQGTSGIFAPVIYSDTERVVGVWRDNKPLYQKSVYVGSLSAGSGVSLAHNIANIDTIANYEGIGFNTVESRWSTLPRVDDDVTYQRGLAVGVTNIVIWGASNVQAMTGVTVTIWYTKTTDVAGSGNWNTDGVPTVHYSTSEQVIGTWIDGKPLYEKTINYGALPSTPNIERDVNHGIPDVDTIWIADGFATNGTFVNQLNLSGVNNAEWFFGVTATYIRCMAQSDRSNYSAYVVLRYTKVTD